MTTYITETTHNGIAYAGPNVEADSWEMASYKASCQAAHVVGALVEEMSITQAEYRAIMRRMAA
jgi:hypothetical protein